MQVYDSGSEAICSDTAILSQMMPEINYIQQERFYFQEFFFFPLSLSLFAQRNDLLCSLRSSLSRHFAAIRSNFQTKIPPTLARSIHLLWDAVVRPFVDAETDEWCVTLISHLTGRVKREKNFYQEQSYIYTTTTSTTIISQLLPRR